jgi:hypothetical protein
MPTIFMTFIELVQVGGWREMLPPFEQPYLKEQNLAGFRVYLAASPGCEIRLVEPEVVIRQLEINAGAIIAIGQSVVVIEQRDIASELTVDEDLRTGKRLRFS